MLASNGKVQEFFNTICKQIRYKNVHQTIIQELSDHIEQQQEEYTGQGMDVETALEKAIEQMGDPVDIGKRFDKAYRPRTDWAMMAIMLSLLSCSGFVQFYISENRIHGPDSFVQFLSYIPLGIGTAAFAYFFDYTLLGRFSKTVFILLSATTAAGFLFFPTVNGAYTFVYYSILLYIPAYAAIISGLRNKGYAGILISGLFYVIPAVFCIAAPRFSSLLLFTVAGMILLTFAIIRGYFGVNKKAGLALIYVPFITVAGMLMTAFIIGQPNRFRNIFHPESDPLGSGYLAVTVNKLIAASRFTGSAVPDGAYAMSPVEKTLPGWNTDFTLTYVITKFGAIAGIIILIALLLFIIKMFMTVLKEKNAFGFLLSMACCIALTGQIIFCVISNLGLVLPVSYALPFITYGRMGFVVNMGLVGLMLSVYRRSKLVRDRVKISKQERSRWFTFSDGKLIIDLSWKNLNSTMEKEHRID